MLLTCIKLNKQKRVISTVLALVIAITSIAGAVFSAPVVVYALSAGGIHTTIASIILSLMLQCGVAPTNTNWINSLNTSYGYTIETAISNGLLTETAEGLIDSGLGASIESATAYTELGLGDIFTTTAADAGVVASSGGVNIATTAINVGTAGTIGAFAGAVAVGVGVGVLANHLIEKYGDNIKTALGIDADSKVQRLVKSLGPGTTVYGVGSSSNPNKIMTYYIFSGTGQVGYYMPSANSVGVNTYSLYKVTDESVPYIEYRIATDRQISRTLSNKYSESLAETIAHTGYIRASSVQEADQKANDIKNGVMERPHNTSPDIVTPSGNAYYDAENDTYPGIGNIIPENGDMRPVDMDGYQNYIEGANNNTANGDTGEAVQGEELDDFLSDYIVAAPEIPDTPIIPDQPVDVPVVPDRPTTPEQPVIPDKPTLTDQEVQDALQGATTIDLRAIFPFCIPFDLYNLLLIFDTGENRRAPHITFTFPITGWIIDVDLAVFDPVAGILRLLELILFIIGLAVATRSLIGAGGG